MGFCLKNLYPNHFFFNTQCQKSHSVFVRNLLFCLAKVVFFDSYSNHFRVFMYVIIVKPLFFFSPLEKGRTYFCNNYKIFLVYIHRISAFWRCSNNGRTIPMRDAPGLCICLECVFQAVLTSSPD